MSSQISREDTGKGFGRFERNNYFHGKLMTARDMETEQLYHRGRLETTARHVLGTGLVTGLQTELAVENGRLEATIESGAALDSRGRPVVVVADGPVAVRSARTGGTEPPGGKDIYVYLEYRACETEQVPDPGSTNGTEGNCSYSRIVEKFELYYTSKGEPFKTVSRLDFPTRQEVEKHDGTADPDDPGLGKMARSYYDRAAESDDGDAIPLLLGRFQKREENGESDAVWTRVEDEKDRRPLVYTNDMLYAMIARHVTNFENPHGIEALRAIAGVGSTDGNVELSSTDETITITRHEKQGKGRVNFDVAAEVVLEEELEEAVNDAGERLSKEVDEVEETLSEEVEGVRSRVGEAEEQLSGEVDEVRSRIDEVDERLTKQVDELDARMDEFEERLSEGGDGRADELDARIDELEDLVSKLQQRLEDVEDEEPEEPDGG